VRPLEIATPRLLLRDFTPQDEAAFVAYHDDATKAAALLRTFAGWRTADPRINVQLAACRRDAVSTLIGCCGLRREGFPPGIAEFGIELAPA
jgi:ribosomal-protein-alanine N-acetyltransferase